MPNPLMRRRRMSLPRLGGVGLRSTEAINLDPFLPTPTEVQSEVEEQKQEESGSWFWDLLEFPTKLFGGHAIAGGIRGFAEEGIAGAGEGFLQGLATIPEALGFDTGGYARETQFADIRKAFGDNSDQTGAANFVVNLAGSLLTSPIELLVNPLGVVGKIGATAGKTAASFEKAFATGQRAFLTFRMPIGDLYLGSIGKLAQNSPIGTKSVYSTIGRGLDMFMGAMRTNPVTQPFARIFFGSPNFADQAKAAQAQAGKRKYSETLDAIESQFWTIFNSKVSPKAREWYAKHPEYHSTLLTLQELGFEKFDDIGAVSEQINRADYYIKLQRRKRLLATDPDFKTLYQRASSSYDFQVQFGKKGKPPTTIEAGEQAIRELYEKYPDVPLPEEMLQSVGLSPRFGVERSTFDSPTVTEQLQNIAPITQGEAARGAAQVTQIGDIQRSARERASGRARQLFESIQRGEVRQEDINGFLAAHKMAMQEIAKREAAAGIMNSSFEYFAGPYAHRVMTPQIKQFIDKQFKSKMRESFGEQGLEISRSFMQHREITDMLTVEANAIAEEVGMRVTGDIPLKDIKKYGLTDAVYGKIFDLEFTRRLEQMGPEGAEMASLFRVSPVLNDYSRYVKAGQVLAHHNYWNTVLKGTMLRDTFALDGPGAAEKLARYETDPSKTMIFETEQLLNVPAKGSTTRQAMAEELDTRYALHRYNIKEDMKKRTQVAALDYAREAEILQTLRDMHVSSKAVHMEELRGQSYVGFKTSQTYQHLQRAEQELAGARSAEHLFDIRYGKHKGHSPGDRVLTDAEINSYVHDPELNERLDLMREDVFRGVDDARRAQARRAELERVRDELYRHEQALLDPKERYRQSKLRETKYGSEPSVEPYRDPAFVPRSVRTFQSGGRTKIIQKPGKEYVSVPEARRFEGGRGIIEGKNTDFTQAGELARGTSRDITRTRDLTPAASDDVESAFRAREARDTSSLDYIRQTYAKEEFLARRELLISYDIEDASPWEVKEMSRLMAEGKHVPLTEAERYSGFLRVYRNPKSVTVQVRSPVQRQRTIQAVEEEIDQLRWADDYGTLKPVRQNAEINQALDDLNTNMREHVWAKKRVELIKERMATLGPQHISFHSTLPSQNRPLGELLLAAEEHVKNVEGRVRGAKYTVKTLGVSPEAMLAEAELATNKALRTRIRRNIGSLQDERNGAKIEVDDLHAAIDGELKELHDMFDEIIDNVKSMQLTAGYKSRIRMHGIRNETQAKLAQLKALEENGLNAATLNEEMRRMFLHRREGVLALNEAKVTPVTKRIRDGSGKIVEVPDGTLFDRIQKNKPNTTVHVVDTEDLTRLKEFREDFFKPDPWKNNWWVQKLDWARQTWAAHVTINPLLIGVRFRDLLQNMSALGQGGAQHPFRSTHAGASIAWAMQKAFKGEGDLPTLLAGKNLDFGNGRTLPYHDILEQAQSRGMVGHGMYLDELSTTLTNAADASGRATIGQALKNALSTLLPVQHPSKSAASRFGYQVATGLDDASRLTGYVDGLLRGMDPDDAAEHVKSLIYDSRQNMSHFEKTVLRRVVPFYSFAKYALSQSLSNYVKRPVFASVFNTIKDTAFRSPPFGGEPIKEDQLNTILPRFMADGLGIPYKNTEAGPSVALFGSFFPIGELSNMMGAIQAAVAGQGDTAIRYIGNKIHPLIKEGIEQIRNRDFYSDREITTIPGEHVNYLGVDVPKRFRHLFNAMRVFNEWDRHKFFTGTEMKAIARSVAAKQGIKPGETVDLPRFEKFLTSPFNPVQLPRAYQVDVFNEYQYRQQADAIEAQKKISLLKKKAEEGLKPDDENALALRELITEQMARLQRRAEIPIEFGFEQDKKKIRFGKKITQRAKGL